MPNVNLDALISREDFEVIETNSRASSFNQNISVKDLERGEFFYAGLRKPDFQRETSDWTDDQLCEFIQSFIDGDLIPAVILWNSVRISVIAIARFGLFRSLDPALFLSSYFYSK